MMKADDVEMVHQNNGAHPVTLSVLQMAENAIKATNAFSPEFSSLTEKILLATLTIDSDIVEAAKMLKGTTTNM